jgi:hypothetical protein
LDGNIGTFFSSFILLPPPQVKKRILKSHACHEQQVKRGASVFDVDTASVVPSDCADDKEALQSNERSSESMWSSCCSTLPSALTCERLSVAYSALCLLSTFIRKNKDLVDTTFWCENGHFLCENRSDLHENSFSRQLNCFHTKKNLFQALQT